MLSKLYKRFGSPLKKIEETNTLLSMITTFITSAVFFFVSVMLPLNFAGEQIKMYLHVQKQPKRPDYC